MRKVYLDVNIVFDYLLKRQPFLEAAEQIVELARQRELAAYVDTQTLVYAFKFLNKVGGPVRAKKEIEAVAKYFQLVSLSEIALQRALRRDYPQDLEDGGQYEIAVENQLEVLITRDAELSLVQGEVLVVGPVEFLQSL